MFPGAIFFPLTVACLMFWWTKNHGPAEVHLTHGWPVDALRDAFEQGRAAFLSGKLHRMPLNALRDAMEKGRAAAMSLSPVDALRDFVEKGRAAAMSLSPVDALRDFVEKGRAAALSLLPVDALRDFVEKGRAAALSLSPVDALRDFVEKGRHMLLGGPPPPPPQVLGSGAMFDSIAAYYDTANRLMSLGFDQSWRRHMIRLLRLQKHDRVLDVSTGTGDVAILIAQQLQALGTTSGQPVVGFDPSPNMLSHAADKLHRGGWTSLVRLMQGDAQVMRGLDRSSFDKITMSFGIRNVPDRPRALRELHRVAKPGATVIVMEFFPPVGPDGGMTAAAAAVFVKNVVPAIGSAISGDARAYNHLSDSIFNFPAAEDFRLMMERSGFASCRLESVFFNVVRACVCTK